MCFTQGIYILVLLTMGATITLAKEPIENLVENLTDQGNTLAMDKRKALFDNKPPRPGVRLALLDMKEMNKKYGLGEVDRIVEAYEVNLSKIVKELKEKGHEVSISKTDFKGYYLTCDQVSSNCLNSLKKEISNVTTTRFSDGGELVTQAVSGNSYQEGYIKARVESQYGKDALKNKSLADFIKDEMHEAHKEATSGGKIDKFAFSQSIDEYRSGGIDKVEKRYRKLIVALDTLLETPFVNSNNLDVEMTNALSVDGKPLGKGRTMSTAISGDDLFMIVKKKGEVEKVIGVDARGLGNLNMQTRYKEYLALDKPIESVGDILKLSNKAIVSADKQMNDSFKLFSTMLSSEFSQTPDIELDTALKRTNSKYKGAIDRGFSLMGTRLGAAESCGSNKKCIMDQITVIHNNVKKMEKVGLEGPRDMSCLSSFYWVNKLGL